MSTIIISLLLAGVLALVIRYLYKQKKQGKTACGCGCSGCSMSGLCHKK